LEEVILLDLSLSHQHNVEQMLWRSAFYQVIETFRRVSSEPRSDGTSGKHLITVLDAVCRVRSDKDRTGTITIVPVRTGTVILEKYRKF